MSIPKLRGGEFAWYAWDREYPDEGSVLVAADTREQAIAEASEYLDIGETEWIEVERADCGRLEAEVIRAAVYHEEVAEEWLGAMERGPASALPGSPIYHKLANAKDGLSAAVDAMLAARGGKGST